MDFFFFYLIFIPIFINYVGYDFLLYFLKSKINIQIAQNSDKDKKIINIIVAVFNEEKNIKTKIKNIGNLVNKNLNFKIHICDGGSSDNTIQILNEIKKSKPYLKLYKTKSGKINQLNHILKKINRSEYVCITDADTLISKSSIKYSIDLLSNDKNIGLVGSFNKPFIKENRFINKIITEYWKIQNNIRKTETLSYSSSVIVAPFYIFKRSLIDLFPEDCVADDVYVSFRCHINRKRVIYTDKILSRETRFPSNINDLLDHFLRKCNAYSIEVIRAMLSLNLMKKRSKLIIFFKFFQFFLYPIFSILFLFLIPFYLYFHTNFTLINFFVSILFIYINSVLSRKEKLKLSNFKYPSIISSFVIRSAIFIILNYVLILNFFKFPFFVQNSQYGRV